MVHVADVVQGMIAAMEKGRTGERYILGGENLTYKQIAQQAIARLSQKTMLIPVLPQITGILSAFDPLISAVGRRPPVTREVHFTASRFQFFTSAKAERELGYVYRPFSAIIEDILEWHDQRTRSIT